MNPHTDKVWQSPEVANRFLSGVRGAIPGAALQLDVMLRLVNSIGRPVRAFLDLGCGAGTLGAALFDAHPDATGVFADFSEPMIVAARRALTGHPKCHFLTLDYADPDWTREVTMATPFDAIVSGFSIHHQPDDRKWRIYSDIFNLLAPGGVFVNVEHVSPSSDLGRRLFEENMIDNIALLERSNGGHRTRDQIRAEYINREDMQANILSPIADQIGWLREIGFADADCYFKLYELAVLAGRKPCAR